MKIFEQIVRRIPIVKGWSGDEKYCAVTKDGAKYFLRISPIERAPQRERLFALLQKAAQLPLAMCQPLEIGRCPQCVYWLQTWIEGQDLEECLPLLSHTRQYTLGRTAGGYLRSIHTLPAPKDRTDWAEFFKKKTDVKIQKYLACGQRFAGDDHILQYLAKNRGLLKNRPQCFQHGDYHAGNMMLQEEQLFLIDFDRYDFGDPWEEFGRLPFTARNSPLFASGLVDGYFDGPPPLDFWRLLLFYIGANTLSSIYWAQDFGPEEVENMVQISQEVLAWHDNMQSPIPTWYVPRVCL